MLQRDVEKVPTLRGRTIIDLFSREPSPRTSASVSSFSLAATQLSTDTCLPQSTHTLDLLNIQPAARPHILTITLSAYSPDIIIMHHPSAGACHMLSANTSPA